MAIQKKYLEYRVFGLRRSKCPYFDIPYLALSREARQSSRLLRVGFPQRPYWKPFFK